MYFWQGAQVGHMQEFRLHDSSHFGSGLHPWFKQSLANFSSGLDAVVFIHLMAARCCCCWLGTVSLTINQIFLQLKIPRKHLGPLGFFLCCLCGNPALTHPWGLPRPNTLVVFQLHQMHLMHPTWFNGAHLKWSKTSGWELSPLPSIVSHHITTRVSTVAYLVLCSWYEGRVFACTLSWGSYYRRPLFTPSFTRSVWCGRRASTVPPQGMHNQRTLNHSFSHAFCPTDFRVWRSIGRLPYQVTSFFRPLQRVENWVDFCFPDSGHNGRVKNGDAFEKLALWPPWQIGRTL